MLKLTRMRGEADAIYVAPSAIAAIEPDGAGGSYVRLTGMQHDYCRVRETPDAIMCMPEMLRHLNPIMQLPITGGAFCPLGSPHCPNSGVRPVNFMPALSGGG